MDNQNKDDLRIDVCLAHPTSPRYITLHLPAGSCIKHALTACGFITEQQIAARQFGIFGQLKPLDTLLKNDDRVEIYCPLEIDPKAARANRVKKARQTDVIEQRKWRQKKSEK